MSEPSAARRLDGKVILVTGAGSGLGRECALLYAEHGAIVVVTDRSEERARETAALVHEADGAADFERVDVTVEEEVAAAIAGTVERHGRLDVLHNNAGAPVRGFGRVPFEELTAEDWRQVIDVNLTSAFYGCKHAIGPMRANGGGSIIITSSASALVGFRGFAPYGAAKGGLNALARGLAVDLGPHNIRVNVLCPMYGMSSNFAQEPDAPVTGRSYEESRGAWDPFAAKMPLKVPRPPTLRDTAVVALFLASDDSAYMSGVAIPTADAGTLSHVAM